MGLRCLLGHNFSAPEIEHERNEAGDEVVTSIREVQTCARCGETRVVSENTEVTTMTQLTNEADAIAAGSSASGETTDSPTAGTADSGTAGVNDSSPPTAGVNEPSPASAAASSVDETHETPPDEGVELIDDHPSPDPTPPAGDSSSTAETEARAVDASDDARAPDDGGVEILDSDATSASGAARERGAWPVTDAEATTGAEATTEDASAADAPASTPWPNHPGTDDRDGASADTGSDADADADADTASASLDASTAGADDTAVANTGTGTGTGTGTSTDLSSGLTRDHSPDLETTSLHAATEYYCPACEMRVDAAGSSLRAGDVCPACRRGYVAERSN